MMTPTAESWPRESFLIRRLSGSTNSSASRSASCWSQFRKNIDADRHAWAGVKSSGYFWDSLMKHIRDKTRSFSYGCSRSFPSVRGLNCCG